MTELLSDTLRERADDVGRPMVDFEAVMKTGDRRRKRRGALVVAGAAAICAIVGVGAVQIAGTSEGANPPEYSHQDAFAERKVTYAAGSTIHYGDTTIDVGKDIEAFVQTDDGFVFTDSEGTAYFADGSAVGTLDHGVGKLRADEAGSYVAWTADSSGTEDAVVFDTSSGAEVARVPLDARRADDARVAAVDGSDVYVTDGRQLKQIDATSGEVARLRGGIPETYHIGDVEDGLILRQLDAGYDLDRTVPRGTVISRDPMATRPRTVEFAHSLSPGATYVAGGPATEHVYDTRTVERIDFDAQGYDDLLVSRWLDDDTVAMMGLRENAGPSGDLQISLLRCEVPSGKCELAADALPGDVKVPIGEDVFH
ncbi:hypothetical protein MU582_15910 [Nocardioidaceae bacterium SCSIO 66511]|nr:hypothetical protein MU582_15910 [Nocardioidaceae bacterium SCSIO 66511]